MPIQTALNNSIYGNITEICRHVYMQTSANPPDQKVIKHLRSKCYEILLKKSNHVLPDAPEINMSLLKKCFIMKSNIQSVNDLERAERLEKCTNKIMQEKIFQKDDFQNVLSLLICLTDHLQYLEPLNLIPWTFGKRDELCLIRSKLDLGSSSLYPMYNIGSFLLNDDLDKEYFKDPFCRRQEAESRGQPLNPYLPNFHIDLLKLEPGSGLPMLGQFLPKLNNYPMDTRKMNGNYSGQFFQLHENVLPSDTLFDRACIKSIKSEISSSSKSSDQRVLFATSTEGIVSEKSSFGRVPSAKSFGTSSSGRLSIKTLTENEDALELWAKLNVYEKISCHRNWMYFGNVNPPREPSFATEADTALFFWSMTNLELNYRKINPLDFIQDLKLLLCGISSTTFMYNESRNTFELVTNIVLPKKSPSAMIGYCESFITPGNWMLRLTKIFSTCKKSDGFIYGAMRKLISEYLFCYQQIIYNLSSNNITEFYEQTLDLRSQIEILGSSLLEESEEFPKGSQLLTMILSKANDVVNRDIELLLFAIIRECCTVYFRILQQWLFTGILYDPYGEIFIEKNNVTQGSRLYWNTGYTLVEKDMPIFLKNISKEILNCGKNLQLLRDCDPTHPLVSTLPDIAPYIPCCLSSTDVLKLSNICNDYNKKAIEACGKMVTIQKHLENQKLKKIQNIALAQRKRAEHYENWKAADYKKKQILKEKKDEQAQMLKQQMKETSTKIENQRREKIREELILIEKDKIAVNQEKQRILDEKIKIKAYYDELNNVALAKARKLEWKNKRSKNEEKRVNLLINEREENLQLVLTINTNNLSALSEHEYVENKKHVENTNLNKEHSNTNNLDVISEQNGLKEENLDFHICNIKTKLTQMDIEANEELNLDDSSNELYSNLNKKDSSESEAEYSSAIASPISDLHNMEDNINKNINSVNDNCLNSLCTDLDNQNDNVTIRDKFNNVIENSECAKRNKLKILGTSEQIDNYSYIYTNNSENLSQAEINKRHILGTSEQTDNYTYFSTDNLDNLSQAELNKRYILGHHYTDESDIKLPIIKTQIQINKENYLAKEFGVNENICAREKNILTLNLNAEGLKNRERMFFSSLNYLSNPEDKIDNECMKTSRSTGHMSVDSTPLSESSKDILILPEQEIVCTADILEIIENHNKDIETADVDLIDGFKFPPVKDEYHLKEKLKENETNNELVYLDEIKNPFTTGLQRLSNKQLVIFDANEDYTDELDIETIKGLSVGNLTSFLQSSVQIPLLAQCDLVCDAVMHYFISEVDILGHFSSLRRFLLLLDGEFGSTLCKEIFIKMESGLMPSHVLSSTVLHDILNSALAACGGASDPNSERLSFRLRGAPPTHWEHSSADALRCLLPSYKAPWPLSMILPQSILDQYALIFQHLVKIRRVAFKLDECFETLSSSLRSCGEDLLYSKQFRSVQLWRGVMSHFIRSLQSYQTGSVLHSATWKFEKLLQGVKSADELYRRHKQYVRYLKFLCLQAESSYKIRKVFDNCFTSIILFNRTLHSGEWILRSHIHEFKHPRYKDLEKVYYNFEDIAAHCFKFCSKLSTCGYQPMLAEFVDLLDMNGYYTKLMEKYT